MGDTLLVSMGRQSLKQRLDEINEEQDRNARELEEQI